MLSKVWGCTFSQCMLRPRTPDLGPQTVHPRSQTNRRARSADNAAHSLRQGREEKNGVMTSDRPVSPSYWATPLKLRKPAGEMFCAKVGGRDGRLWQSFPFFIWAEGSEPGHPKRARWLASPGSAIPRLRTLRPMRTNSVCCWTDARPPQKLRGTRIAPSRFGGDFSAAFISRRWCPDS